MAITEDNVLGALRTVIDPDLHKDLVTLGMIKNVAIDGGRIAFTVELTTPACPLKAEIEQMCRDAVSALTGVTEIVIEMSAMVRANQGRGISSQQPIEGVKNIIAVASGKGGVGKSTVSANIACALAQMGAKVGLMDADIYGPSIHIIMGAEDDRPITDEGKEQIIPIERYGVKIMSMGFLQPSGSAVIWRGPMVAKAVQQFLRDVKWGEIDYLIVDLPPGTGDAQLTLAQAIPLTGAVVVMTPQDLAAAVAVKAVSMFKRLDVPILGIVNEKHVVLSLHGLQCEALYLLVRRRISGRGGAASAVLRRSATGDGHWRRCRQRRALGCQQSQRPVGGSLPRHRRQNRSPGQHSGEVVHTTPKWPSKPTDKSYRGMGVPARPFVIDELVVNFVSVT